MKKIYLLIIIISSMGCSKEAKLKDFNSELWKMDKKGCEGKRRILVEKILSQSIDLRGVDDDDIIDLLGKPEGSNWETRGKKTFFYYTGKGAQCDANLLLPGPKLEIEFNALGQVNLITESNY